MPVAKLSISLAPEVDQALEVLVTRSGQAKSALIEVALRENPLIAKYIEVVRLEMLATPTAIPRREDRMKAKAPRRVERAAP